ncbi:rhodanese-related sulfurtransferase [Candidatus Woesearchaeota archaeon]|nr:rhodanese-related sulfurtransferase [Candidatus Woesearchaeota archaeon]
MFEAITFYKYVELDNPDYWMNKFRWICEELNLFGRILISTEGVNGALCGTEDDIEEFKRKIKQSNEFSNLTFREMDCKEQVYHKLVVRIRDEIVVFGEKVNLNNLGGDITSEELKRLLDKKEKIVLLDARNDYEYKLGRFKNARLLKMKNFKEFPSKINEIKDLKDKKIVMYCTGGIRCEKSSAFLKENGFKDVNKLKGGIIEFINKYPKTYFEGGLFVFDDRLINQSGEPITKCVHCKNKSDVLINCHNLDCDKLHISCYNCQEEFNHCCSIECKQAERHREEVVVAR